MQSDTFLKDTDSEDEAYQSDSSGDIPKTNNIGVTYDFSKDPIEDARFLDQSRQEKYLEIRNELFTRPIESGRILLSTTGNIPTTSLSIDLVDKYKLGNIKNVIGFELIKCNLKNSPKHDRSFVDIFIPEIPHKACKINENGLPIIDRATLTSDSESFYEYEPHRSYTNYFSPIQLSKLTLKLIDSYDANSPEIFLEGSYEFEITILKQSLSQR